MDSESLILSELRRNGVMRAKEIAENLRISQPTVSRRLAELSGQRLLRMGRAKNSRYAALRKIADLGYSWPIFRIDEEGRSQKAGTLTSLYSGKWHVEADERLQLLLRGDFKEGIFPGFPWFLEDQRPQGFLGRHFARRHAHSLGVESDPRIWSSDDLLRVLLSYGNDSVGNFILGNSALESQQKVRLNGVSSIRIEERAIIYPQRAQEALLGDTGGSSAGGEQPKFVATLDEGQGNYRQALIKFSAKRETPSGRRWADLLHCEHFALDTLRRNRVEAAESEIIVSEERVFLEVTRFDRVGAYGRRGLFSLASFDAAYFGEAHTPWISLARRLEIDGWISLEEGRGLRLLWWFGTLIANNDMHYGNVSLMPQTNGTLRIAPCYDMLPMFYAPSATGEIMEREWNLVPPPPNEMEEWSEASRYAIEFWNQVHQSSDIAPEFREIAARHCKTILRIRDLCG